MSALKQSEFLQYRFHMCLVLPEQAKNLAATLSLRLSTLCSVCRY